MGITVDSGPWKEWFAWRPVTLINGKRVWWRKIYRKNIYLINAGSKGMWVQSVWIYGTIIDVLSE